MIQPRQGKGDSFLRLTLKVYMVPLDSFPITFPYHKCIAVITAAGQTVGDEFPITLKTPRGKAVDYNRRSFSMSKQVVMPLDVPLDVKDDAIQATPDEIFVRGPGRVEIDGQVIAPSMSDWQELHLSVALTEAVTESRILLTVRLFRKDAEALWTLAR